MGSRDELLVVPLDDFDLILGIEFLSGAQAMLAPHLGGVLICDEERPCFVQRNYRHMRKGKDIEL